LFIKTTRAKGYEYIKLVESYRENGTTKHNVLYNFGRADLIKQDDSFLRVVRRLCEVADIPVDETDMNVENKSILDDCSEATMYNYGYLAYRALWNELGIQDCLEEVESTTKISYSLTNAVFLMAVQHLLEPRSKSSTHQHQCQYFNMKEIALHHMYRALDKLCDNKEEIESCLFEYNYVRVHKEVDVVFYDVTTISFESIMADELRNFGFSKECKFNEVQVVMGMIIDSNGIPVGYELFPGNTFDGKTMVKALKNIKKRFGIKRVIIVADRGLNSKGNLSLIKDAGYGYIMASKIKGMSAAMKKKILDPTDFITVEDPKKEKAAEDSKDKFRCKTISYENVFTDEDGVKRILQENLVISYSPKRAKKDAADRKRLIEKAEKMLKDPEKINASNKRGGKKYIVQESPEESTTWRLAVEKIEEDAKFDGYYGIQSSEKNMSATDIMDAYSTLWKIEESFRIMKSTLEVQPVFHWTEDRIKGHFVVCFLAFLLERRMELLLKTEADDCLSSPERIREALRTMQLAAVTTDNREVFIKAKPAPLAQKIFKKLDLRIPTNINEKDELIAIYRHLDEPLVTQLSIL
jgi:transposase